MPAPSSDLPSARTFLTSLINSLPSSSPPLPTTNPKSASATSASSAPPPAQPQNPLNSVPDAAKKQFLTLHALFPNDLLPALDLLDRRLVVRFNVIREEPGMTRRQQGDRARLESRSHAAVAERERVSMVPRGQEGFAETAGDYNGRADATSNGNVELSAHSADDLADKSGNGPQQSSTAFSSIVPTDTAVNDGEVVVEPPLSSQTIHYVRSAQSRPSRFGSSYDTTTHYEVRLQAWNCSCPAFAFAAFPATLPSDSQIRLGSRTEESGSFKAPEDGGEEWEFGGLARGDAIPPVCKHLLACVLVERCGLFGEMVEERDISVEEAAGWAAGWGD